MSFALSELATQLAAGTVDLVVDQGGPDELRLWVRTEDGKRTPLCVHWGPTPLARGAKRLGERQHAAVAAVEISTEHETGLVLSRVITRAMTAIRMAVEDPTFGIRERTI